MALLANRRTALGSMLAVGATAALPLNPARAATTDAPRWQAAWGAALQPAGAAEPLPPGTRISRRLRPTVAGTALRVELSNRYGLAPLTVACRLRAGADEWPLTFGGLATMAVPRGGVLVSDPLALDLAAGQALGVIVELPLGGTRGYIELMGGTGEAMLHRPGQAAEAVHPAILTTLEVMTTRLPGFAVLGDTKGARPGSWVDRLGELAQGRFGVVNRSVFGGRLALGDEVSNALARLDHDVLATTGLSGVIVLCGNNDLIQPGMIGSRGAPLLDPALMLDRAGLCALLAQVSARARGAGLLAIAGTWLPYEGVTIAQGYSTPEKMALRHEVNDWMRSSGTFDAVIDLDAALRDPARPTRLDPAYDEGNHFTQNAAGSELMAHTALAALLPLASHEN